MPRLLITIRELAVHSCSARQRPTHHDNMYSAKLRRSDQRLVLSVMASSLCSGLNGKLMNGRRNSEDDPALASDRPCSASKNATRLQQGPRSNLRAPNLTKQRINRHSRVFFASDFFRLILVRMRYGRILRVYQTELPTPIWHSKRTFCFYHSPSHDCRSFLQRCQADSAFKKP